MTVPEMGPSASAGLLPVLASLAERDAVAMRLQAAFAEHRLDEDEFDQRIKLALTARTTAELAGLVADLPASAQGGANVGPVAASGKPGKFALAMKSSLRRAGRWSVPARFYSVVYKGGGLLDLRQAEFTAPVVTIVAISYKSRTEILLPPHARVELGGLGVSSGRETGETGETGEAALARTPIKAPVVRVKGVAYKGAIEVA